MKTKKLYLLVGMLLLSTLSACTGQKTKTTNSFEGMWAYGDSKDDQYASTYVFFQRGNRVCGFWHYVATYHEYDGRLIGHVSDDILTIDKACGASGSFAKTACPAWEQIGDEVRAWSAPEPTHFLVCGNSLTESPDKSQLLKEKANKCTFGGYTKGNDVAGYAYNKNDTGKGSDLDWVNTCLSGKDD